MGRLSKTRFFFLVIAVVFFFAFDPLPGFEELFLVFELHGTEYMRMAPDHFVRAAVQGLVQREGFAAGVQLGYEQQQKQTVAQFFAGFLRIAAANGLHQFEGFFNDIIAEAFRGLFLIPGAAIRPQ